MYSIRYAFAVVSKLTPLLSSEIRQSEGVYSNIDREDDAVSTDGEGLTQDYLPVTQLCFPTYVLQPFTAKKHRLRLRPVAFDMFMGTAVYSRLWKGVDQTYGRSRIKVCVCVCRTVDPDSAESTVNLLSLLGAILYERNQ